jgi:uncharacterized damage-inducible protein DinB
MGPIVRPVRASERSAGRDFRARAKVWTDERRAATMAMIDSFIGELEHEAGLTRKMLERVPEDKLGWKPHPKSFSLGQLASHVADILMWSGVTMKQNEFAMDPAQYKPFVGASRAEIVARFDEALKVARAAMAGTPDAAMMETWRFVVAGEVKFEMPRAAVLRGMIMNHLIHHRAQLGVYLRLNDVPLPAIYGPSADEPL